MDPENRIKYYIGNLSKSVIKIDSTFDNSINCNKYIVLNDTLLTNTLNTIKLPVIVYFEDIHKYILSANIPKDYKFLVAFGDVEHNCENFTITKTRPINYTPYNNILLNLNKENHWNTINEVKKKDILFAKKNNKLLWRGASTGRGKRVNLVNKFQNHSNKMIDIKFSNLCYKIKSNEYILDRMTIADMLQSKFIISIEGNDVATNLKWILFSNSCVIMPKPTMASWLMEDKLVPYVHYVPIKDDYSDLESQYDWCLKNLDKCDEIAQNGKKYIMNFLDEKTENYITSKVLQMYYDNVKIEYKSN